MEALLKYSPACGELLLIDKRRCCMESHGIYRDIANGNTVSATIACSYGCFWISYAISLIPSFHVRDAYPSDGDYNHANGLFLMVGPPPATANSHQDSPSLGILYLLGCHNLVLHEIECVFFDTLPPCQLHLAFTRPSQSRH